MQRVGLLRHPHRERAASLAEEIASFLRRRGIAVWESTAENEEQLPSLPGRLDLVITLGGDGTVLRAARLVARRQIPLLGVNLGRIGFLAEVRADGWEEALERVLAGEYWLEERGMLQAMVRRGETLCGPWEALNEVVVGRSTLARVVHLPTYIDGGYLTTYVADGLIIATATGSTAYALAAGGPILPPELRNILLVPIAPYLSLDRAIVLAEGVEVTVRPVVPDDGVLTLDGECVVRIATGDEVVVRASPHSVSFVRLYDRRMLYATLMERLQPRRE